MARVLLLFARSMFGALLVGALTGQPGWGCVLPPDLESEGADAGPSAPPVILSASPGDFAFPGPITIDREQVNLILTLTVEDNDLGDSLYAKFYRDYNRMPVNQPTPALVDCAEPGPSTSRSRTIDCRINPLCNGAPDNDALHVVEVMISDQPFIADSDPEAFGQDTYRAVANKDRAGYSLRAWTMRCQSPQ